MFIGFELVSYDDDCCYGGNVCYSDVFINICCLFVYVFLYEFLLVKELF